MIWTIKSIAHVVGLMCCCYSWVACAAPYPEADETPVYMLPLSGPVAQPESELSALSWCQDDLWLVPQYPNFDNRNNKQMGHFYRLRKPQLIDAVHRIERGQPVSPLVPDAIPIGNLQALENLPGYQGIEAFACDDSGGYLAIEINRWGRREATVLAKLEWETTPAWRVAATSTRMLSFTNIPNKGNESLLITDQGLLNLHEVNSQRLQRSGAPQALLLNNQLQTTQTVAMADIPYRVTDASALDSNNRFWVINYLWSGDLFIQQDDDEFWQQYGQGKSHASSKNVERLIELQWTGTEIQRTDRAPLNLALVTSTGRNWEGLARLDDLGFLLVTDKHPKTLLGYVPQVPFETPQIDH